jgi:hypothetical protein
LNADEQAAGWALVGEVRERLLAELKSDGFNIGVNDRLLPGRQSVTLMCTSFPDVRETCPIRAAASAG